MVVLIMLTLKCVTRNRDNSDNDNNDNWVAMILVLMIIVKTILQKQYEC